MAGEGTTGTTGSANPQPTIQASGVHELTFELVRGQDSRNKITYTPKALRSGATLFWALQSNFDFTIGGLNYRVDAGTIVASTIVAVATQLDDDQMPMPKSNLPWTHLLLLRFDSLQGDAIHVLSEKPESYASTKYRVPSITLSAAPIVMPGLESQTPASAHTFGFQPMSDAEMGYGRVVIPMSDHIPPDLIVHRPAALAAAAASSHPASPYHCYIDKAAFAVRLSPKANFEQLTADDTSQIDTTDLFDYFQARLLDDKDLGVDRMDQHH